MYRHLYSKNTKEESSSSHITGLLILAIRMFILLKKKIKNTRPILNLHIHLI